jgi:uncharacterized tellurite resistance protein B-like protein
MAMTPMQKVEILKAACCVAGVDRTIDDNELPLLQKIAKEVGVGRASLSAMIRRASEDANFHQGQFQVLKENPRACMAVIVEVARGDGKINDQELQILQSLAANLNLPDEELQQLIGG